MALAARLNELIETKGNSMQLAPSSVGVTVHPGSTIVTMDIQLDGPDQIDPAQLQKLLDSVDVASLLPTDLQKAVDAMVGVCLAPPLPCLCRLSCLKACTFLLRQDELEADLHGMPRLLSLEPFPIPAAQWRVDRSKSPTVAVSLYLIVAPDTDVAGLRERYRPAVWSVGQGRALYPIRWRYAVDSALVATEDALYLVCEFEVELTRPGDVLKVALGEVKAGSRGGVVGLKGLSPWIAQVPVLPANVAEELESEPELGQVLCRIMLVGVFLGAGLLVVGALVCPSHQPCCLLRGSIWSRLL